MFNPSADKPIVWFGQLLCYVTMIQAFTLWNPGSEHLGNSGLLSLMNICPMLDCGTIESQLVCAHQDRYITEMEIMGRMCTGCPACRDFNYFVKVSDKAYKLTESVLIRTEEYAKIAQSIMDSVELLQRKAREATPVGPAPAQTIEKLSQELHTMTEDSSMVKVARYLEENGLELQDIVSHGTLEETRLDLNTHGFYGHFWQASLPQYDSQLLPLFDRHRFAELMNDRLLDKVAELLHLTERIDSSTEMIRKLVLSLKESTNETRLQELEDNTPLLLRRLYQLLESNNEALSAFIAIDIRDLQSLGEILSKSVNVNDDTSVTQK